MTIHWGRWGSVGEKHLCGTGSHTIFHIIENGDHVLSQVISYRPGEFPNLRQNVVLMRGTLEECQAKAQQIEDEYEARGYGE